MVVMEAMADIQVFNVKFVANLDMMLLFAIIILMKTVPTMSLNPSSVNPPLHQGILHLGFPALPQTALDMSKIQCNKVSISNCL